jgi:hypothetical protein
MSENKIGDVVVLKTETQQQAFYQLADGTSAFLAAISLDDYEIPFLRERFFVLATEIVLARIRATGSNVRFVQRHTAPSLEANPDANLPCWSCPRGADVRDWLRLGQDGHRSPSGLPMNCCRICAVGAFGSAGELTPRSAARR